MNSRGSDTVGVGREARIVGELLDTDAAEVARLPIIAGGDDQRAVGGFEHLIGHEVGMRVAHAARRRAGDQIVQRLIGEHGDLRVEQRHVDLGARGR